MRESARMTKPLHKVGVDSRYRGISDETNRFELEERACFYKPDCATSDAVHPRGSTKLTAQSRRCVQKGLSSRQY